MGQFILKLFILFKGFIFGIINTILCVINILKSVFGLSPKFVGQKRLANRVLHHLQQGSKILTVKQEGIYCEDKLLEKLKLPVMKFIPSEGVTFSEQDTLLVKKILHEAVTRKDSLVARRYYRLIGIAKMVVLGYFLSGLYLCVTFGYENRLPRTWEKIQLVLWIIPNLFFLTQSIIFYVTRVHHLSMKNSFSEAGEEEIKQLKALKNQPKLAAVVPAYMEEPALLKRVLYSVCLQDYKNMKATLLLGNDVLSSDEKVLKNIKDVKRLVAGIKLDLRKQRRKIENFYKDYPRIQFQRSSELKERFNALAGLYRSISEWYLAKGNEFLEDTTKYPLDNYLIENTFKARQLYFEETAGRCASLADAIQSTDIELNKHVEVLEELYNDLEGLFNIPLGIFTRTRYENLEQEKTKAGNLTAYSSIIGGTWRTEKQSNGRYLMIPSAKGRTIEKPKYFSSFDSDTVIKPDYIIRKVAFMERPENQEVGLIQSPYVVPAPEESNVASASGIYTYWFVPMSVGFTKMKCACWLGFNGVLRFEAVQKIKSFITDTLIEDTQNSLKIKKHGYKIFTSPEENCMTFSPEDLNALKVQRIRWASGGFKIALNLIGDFKKKQSGMNGFWEKALCLNYILGLNLLPIAFVLLLFIQSTFHYQNFFVESLPLFFYLFSYYTAMKALTKYKLIHMLDGLALSPFLTFYYIAGTLHCINQCIELNARRFFKSTPKNEKLSFRWMGNIEFIGIIIYIIWGWIRLVNQFKNQIYYDFNALSQIALALYGVDRFYGWENVGAAIKNVKIKALFIGIASPIKNAFFALIKKRYKRSFKIALSCLLVVALSGTSVAMVLDARYRENLSKEVQQYLDVGDTSRKPLDPYEQNQRLGKGLNLASALEAPNEGDWVLILEEEHFKIIKDGGFDTIRVPIRWSAHASKSKPYTVNERFFERIDWILLHAKKNDLNVVLDFHNYYEIYQKNYEKHFERFISIWKQIAQRYKDFDRSVYYELINEPRDYLTIQEWNRLLEMTIDEIRAIDDYHTIIIDAAEWGSVYGLMGVVIPDREKNAIASFHTYTPQMFTHQGATYAPDEFRYCEGVVWPGPPEEYTPVPNRIKKYPRAQMWFENYNNLPYEENPAGPKPILEELDFGAEWGRENNRPIWLGEFGAVNKTDEASQIRWTAFVVREAEKRGMTWAYWDFADTCKVYDLKKGKWKEGLLNALIPKE